MVYQIFNKNQNDSTVLTFISLNRFDHLFIKNDQWTKLKEKILLNIKQVWTRVFSDDFPTDENAVQLYQRFANQGNASGMVRLALTFDYANENMEQAFQYYKTGVEKGIAGAQWRLGVLYLDGRGTRQDLEEGFKNIKMAAEQGFALAQSTLGLLYLNGEGVNKI